MRDQPSLMRRFVLQVLLVALTSQFAFSQVSRLAKEQQPAAAQIPDFVAVHLRFPESISSATARVGQHVALEVAEDKVYGNRPVVLQGTVVDGSIIKAVRRGRNRRNGELVIKVDRVRLANGSFAPVTSAQTKIGDSTTRPIFGPCTFPLPAEPIAVFHRGQNVVIASGTEMVGILSSENLQ